MTVGVLVVFSCLAYVDVGRKDKLCFVRNASQFFLGGARTAAVLLAGPQVVLTVKKNLAGYFFFPPEANLIKNHRKDIG